MTEVATIQKYYSSGSAQIAVRTISETSDTLQWMLSDHLGSTSTTANADGSWNSSISYTAFGEIRASSGITASDFRYTGQLRQAELGLYYYVARWYDPQLAHFTQADTVVPNAGDAASYDRYTYVRNNPVKYSDPSGHMRVAEGDMDCSSFDCQIKTIASIHSLVQDKARRGVYDDREALARLSDYAAIITKNDTRRFIYGMGAVLTGHDGKKGTATANELLFQVNNRLSNNHGITITHNKYNSIYTGNRDDHKELMQSGYAKEFQDPDPKDGGNQAHHYWYYVQVGYEWTPIVGTIGSFLHETVLSNGTAGRSFQDYALGVEGSKVGFGLSIGAIQPNHVGNIIRESLAPGSATSYLWSTEALMQIYKTQLSSYR